MNYTVNNSVEEWIECKNKIENDLKSNNYSSEDIVTVNAVVSDCVENLIYFFPISDMARVFRLKSELHITVSNTINDAQKLKYKIKHFLFIQQLFRKSLSITINGDPNSMHQTRFGRLQPLFAVTNQDGAFCYKSLFHSALTFSSFDYVLKTYISESLMCNQLTAKEKKRLESFIADRSDFYSHAFLDENNVYFKEDSDKKILWGKLFNIKPDDDMSGAYSKMVMSNLFYSIDTLAGIQKIDEYKKTDKKRFIDELINSISEIINDLPILTQYIWSLLLRLQLESKNLQLRQKVEKTYYRSVFDTTLIQAEALADGLYQLIENACLHAKSHSGYFYLRVHETKISKKANDSESFTEVEKRAKILSQLSKEYSPMELSGDDDYHLEIVFIDNAFDKDGICGMVDNYNLSHPNHAPIQNLTELFWRVPKETDDLIIHYGLRVFERTVRMNNGAFMVYTPSADPKIKGFSYQSVNEKVYDTSGKHSAYYHGTIYRILLPINDKVNYNSKEHPETISLFDISQIRNTMTPYWIRISARPSFSTYEKKKENVEWVYQQINDNLNKNADLDKQIICIYPDGFGLNHMEILAKALINYLLKHKSKKNYFALLFSNKHQIIEFVRTYTAFFDRSGLNYEHFELEDTQIAICLEKDGQCDVCFILSGNDLHTAVRTVRNYLYYHSEAIIEFFPVILYLTGFMDDKKETKTEKTVFPFDCYLDLASFDHYDNHKADINYKDTWFFNRIHKALEKDMQTNGYGCKISNVHVSLGSKIHTDTFYNAELLFHSYANVFRFAYFVARDVLNEHYSAECPAEKIVMVAYGEYSLLLIQTICNIINSYDPDLKANYILFPSYLSEEEQRNWQTQGKEFDAFVEEEKIDATKSLKGYTFYIVVPISTTLTTVNKIKYTLERKCKQQDIEDSPEFGMTTSIIVAGGVEDNKGITMGYWKEVQKEHRLIVIDDATCVRYYFNKSAQWFKASSKEGCMLCNNTPGSSRKSLIGVDKTSTLPNAIFDTLDRKKKTFDIDSDNDTKLKQLYGTIKYSHISNEQNHYLYDIDYESYCRDEAVQKNIAEWLKNKVYPNIDRNAFNIVVSPLDSANSEFLHLVLEHAFGGCSRVINIKFHTAYRDEIRSKLEYITEEYNQLTRSIHDIKIHIYFVDDCIIEGSTFQRSKQFLYMLLPDSGLATNDVSLYKGIILLSNRSSFDTIQNLLGKNAEKSTYYYMRLNVPSFNTNNRICPACDLSEQYLLMKKRAATSIITAEYQRLYNKHNVKTRVEYLNWLDNLLRNDNYFSKLKAWLYYSLYYNKNQKKYYYTDIEGNTFPVDASSPCFDALLNNGLLDQIMNGKESLTKDKIEDGFSGERTVVDLLKRHFLADKDYCRMICTHEIFTAAEDFYNEAAEKAWSTEKYENAFRKKILDIIQKRLLHIDKISKTLQKKTKLWLKAEWIISYIKIISRKQPAQYYHLRNAIYNILMDFLDSITGKCSFDDIKFLTDLCIVSENQNHENSIMPDMKFRIFLTAVRRLSAMHSSYLIENIDTAFDYYYRCREQYYGNSIYHLFFKGVEKTRDTYHSLVEYPDELLFNMNISKLTKWSSMYGVDDCKCFLVERLFSEKLSDSAAIKLAYLENTQVIYSGIKKLVLDYKMNEEYLTEKAKVDQFVKDVLETEKVLINNHQNSMSLYNSFLEFEEYPNILNDRDKTKKLSFRISRMMMLFDMLCKLEGKTTPIQDPYDYVHLCNYIRDITGYWQCKIISCREHNVSVVTSSDIHKSYFMNDIKEDEMDIFLSEFCRNAQGDNLLNKIAQKFKLSSKITGDKSAELMIVSLLTSQINSKSYYQPNYYLVLYKEKLANVDLSPDMIEFKDLRKQDLKGLRNILFLRDRLEFVLSRDVSELYGMISSYDYVKPLVDDRKPVILHMSDLHIHANKDKDSYYIIPESVKKLIRSEGKTLKPDLLLITGDVVNGNYSAAGLQNAYENALTVIKFIARILWRDDDCKYVRSDWNKRILISTGNHDYASMNELEAKNKKRSTTSGKPGALGDVMIKHSYFINFLHRLLGNDIDNIIKYDLNQVVNYKRLGISVININTNSDVNPYRTNKVKINTKAINRMLSNVSLNNKIVYMMHHSPIYHLDYIDDVYYFSLEPEKEKDLDAAVKKAFSSWGISYPPKTLHEIWISLIRAMAVNFSEKIYDLDEEKEIALMKVFIDKLGNRQSGADDFSYVLSCENRECDDRCINIMFELQALDYATEKDTEEYVNFAKTHFDEMKKKSYDSLYIILGGHTHQAAYYRDSMSGCMSNCLGIFETGMSFTEKDGAIETSYSVITMDDPVQYECKGTMTPINKRDSLGMLEKIISEKDEE